MPKSDSASAISTSGQSTFMRLVAISSLRSPMSACMESRARLRTLQFLSPASPMAAYMESRARLRTLQLLSPGCDSCGADLHQRPQQRYCENTRNRRDCRRQRRPDDDLHEQLGTM